MTLTPPEFIANIPQTDECVVWPFHLKQNGYGQHRGRLAHRMSYEVHNGSIPCGMTVDHMCFNPACVNPRHLSLETHTDNAARQRSASKTHCKHGHEFTPENTYFKALGPARSGRRTCRSCQRAAVARYKARSKAA